MLLTRDVGNDPRKVPHDEPASQVVPGNTEDESTDAEGNNDVCEPDKSKGLSAGVELPRPLTEAEKRHFQELQERADACDEPTEETPTREDEVLPEIDLGLPAEGLNLLSPPPSKHTSRASTPSRASSKTSSFFDVLKGPSIFEDEESNRKLHENARARALRQMTKAGRELLEKARQTLPPERKVLSGPGHPWDVQVSVRRRRDDGTYVHIIGTSAMLPPTSLDAIETAHVAASLILCDAIDREARESSTEPIPEDELSSRRLALVLAGRSRDATNIGHLTNERNVARARAEQLETDVATLRAEVEDLTRKLDTATLEAETLESSEYGVAVRALMDRAADFDLPATAQGLRVLLEQVRTLLQERPEIAEVEPELQELLAQPPPDVVTLSAATLQATRQLISDVEFEDYLEEQAIEMRARLAPLRTVVNQVLSGRFEYCPLPDPRAPLMSELEVQEIQALANEIGALAPRFEERQRADRRRAEVHRLNLQRSHQKRRDELQHRLRRLKAELKNVTQMRDQYRKIAKTWGSENDRLSETLRQETADREEAEGRQRNENERARVDLEEARAQRDAAVNRSNEFQDQVRQLQSEVTELDTNWRQARNDHRAEEDQLKQKHATEIHDVREEQREIEQRHREREQAWEREKCKMEHKEECQQKKHREEISQLKAQLMQSRRETTMLARTVSGLKDHEDVQRGQLRQLRQRNQHLQGGLQRAALDVGIERQQLERLTREIEDGMSRSAPATGFSASLRAAVVALTAHFRQPSASAQRSSTLSTTTGAYFDATSILESLPPATTVSRESKPWQLTDVLGTREMLEMSYDLHLTGGDYLKTKNLTCIPPPNPCCKLPCSFFPLAFQLQPFCIVSEVQRILDREQREVERDERASGDWTTGVDFDDEPPLPPAE